MKSVAPEITPPLPHSGDISVASGHARRRCRLVLIAHPAVNHTTDFKKIADYIREYDPLVFTTVIGDRRRGLFQLATTFTLPTLVISFVPLARFRPPRGRFLHGLALSKSEEYSRLEAAGFPVPQWQLIRPEEKPDLSDYGPYVVTKPDRGMRGALVKIKKAGRVRYKKKDGESLPAGRYGASIPGDGAMLAQQFIYTGPWPISYRVTTLFGQVLHSWKTEASHERNALPAADAFGNLSGDKGVSIVSSGTGCTMSLNYDEEVIRLGEAAHAVFPEVPLLGFDIVREMPSGKLYILEANAVGYVWHFSSPMGLGMQRDNHFNLESQFDGLRKAAHILADKAQELAQ